MIWAILSFLFFVGSFASFFGVMRFFSKYKDMLETFMAFNVDQNPFFDIIKSMPVGVPRQDPEVDHEKG